MLKKFVNAKTGKAIVFEKDLDLTRANIEGVFGMEIKGEIPFSKDKDAVEKKEKTLTANEEK